MATKESNFQYYLEPEGVKGGATQKDHKEWIQLQNYHVGLNHERTDGKASEKVQVSAFIFNKLVDPSSPLLAKKCYHHKEGGVIAKATVHVCQDEQPYLVYKMKNVYVTDISAGAGEGTPTETVTLRPEVFQWDHTASGNKAGWDLVKGEEAAS